MRPTGKRFAESVPPKMGLVGFITECDREAAEAEFPGIWNFYHALPEKPCTFLELAWSFVLSPDGCSSTRARS